MARTLLKQRGDVGHLLGRRRDDGRVHPQPLAHQDSRLNEPIRGLAWVQDDGWTPPCLWLPRLCQGAENISNLDDRSTPGLFISHAEGVKAYNILDPVT